MNNITKNQLAAMLLITDAFTLFCFMGKMSLVTVLGLSIGIVLQFIMAIPVICLGGEKSKWENWFYLVYLIMWGGLLFRMQWNASKIIYIPYENSGGIWGKLLISELIALVCLYISSTGMKSLARSSLIAAAVGAVCLLVAAISATADMNWKNLTRADSGRSFLDELLTGFVLSGGLGSFAVLLKMTKGHRLKNSIGYFIGKIVLTAIVTVTAVLVAGGIMKVVDFPVITAAQLSQPFASQRIDSLFLIVFAIFAVFSIAVQMTSAAYIIGELFPSFTKYRSSCSLILMIGAAFLLSKLPPYSTAIAIAVIAAFFAVPLIKLICLKLKGEKLC